MNKKKRRKTKEEKKNNEKVDGLNGERQRTEKEEEAEVGE